MVIDFHTHIFPPFFREDRKRFFPDEPAFEQLYSPPRSRLVGAEELIRSMDEEGVHKSVVFGFPWKKAAYFRRHNDYILESVMKYPDRLIGFCCLSPLSPAAAREVQRCLDSGLSGVGEIALYGRDLSSRDISRLKAIMAACEGFDVPLLLHVNEPVGPAYPGKAPITLTQVYLLLKTYPNNKIVLSHWGGGLFFYALMKKEVKDVLRNTWFDTAASPYLYSAGIYRAAVEILGEDKILFGTDYPLLSPKRYFQEMGSLHLSRVVCQKISGENAVRLLGLTDEN